MRKYETKNYIKEIRIGDIEILNKRHELKPEKFRIWTAYIRKFGIEKPINVIKRGNKYYVGKDIYKVLALMKLGYEKVECLVQDRSKEMQLKTLNNIQKEETNCRNKLVMLKQKRNNIIEKLILNND